MFYKLLVKVSRWLEYRELNKQIEQFNHQFRNTYF